MNEEHTLKKPTLMLSSSQPKHSKKLTRRRRIWTCRLPQASSVADNLHPAALARQKSLAGQPQKKETFEKIRFLLNSSEN